MLTSSMSYISIRPYSCNIQVFSSKFPRPCCIPKMHNISSCKFDFARPWSHGMWRSLSDSISTRNHLLHRFHINALSDEDFKSSRNIAKSIFRRYRNVVDRGGFENLKEFISACVNAYALGCTEEGLRKELIDMKESGTEIEGLQIHGGGTTVKFKVLYEEPTVVRWSSTPPVSDEILQQWKGFCAIIANAYYMRGMAWLPVKTLQLEQMAVMGSAEEPSVVASRMQLVFSTLEVVSPQWPRV
ncbi:orotidine 5'-phosphate decarboxylase [Rhynchospora pubera]|uniref:Orotidine 5'-phosphate decarboxylase n=1 Tax=Rhynchospora pubera TaxID=906938 RepID=A0AAV8FQ27_9POAL|nr:orotidine 5'-phosphate decarboxylase [Rhynchospora pubera]